MRQVVTVKMPKRYQRICCWCQKPLDPPFKYEEGANDESETLVTHGICQTCQKKTLQEFLEE